MTTLALIGIHSIYIQYNVQPVAAPLVMHMCGYIRGVATVYPYPADGGNTQTLLAGLCTLRQWGCKIFAFFPSSWEVALALSPALALSLSLVSHYEPPGETFTT